MYQGITQLLKVAGVYFLGGTGLNIAQEMYPLTLPPLAKSLNLPPHVYSLTLPPLENPALSRIRRTSDPDAALASMSRAEIVRLWHSLPPPPHGSVGGSYEGRILRKGPLHPVSRLVTHRLFGGNRGVWLGKEIRENGSTGKNILKGRSGRRLGRALHRCGSNGNNMFVDADGSVLNSEGSVTRFRDFKVERKLSALDSRPAIILNYDVGGEYSRSSSVWRGMRDELRMLQPGYLIGLGSMKVFGGMANSCLFTLRKTD